MINRNQSSNRIEYNILYNIYNIIYIIYIIEYSISIDRNSSALQQAQAIIIIFLHLQIPEWKSSLVLINSGTVILNYTLAT